MAKRTANSSNSMAVPPLLTRLLDIKRVCGWEWRQGQPCGYLHVNSLGADNVYAMSSYTHNDRPAANGRPNKHFDDALLRRCW